MATSSSISATPSDATDDEMSEKAFRGEDQNSASEGDCSFSIHSNSRTPSSSDSDSDSSTTLSIWPTRADINRGEPQLNSNIVEQAYESVDQYLDIQSRLVREELVKPLREDIRKIRDEIEKDGPNRRLDEGMINLNWNDLDELRHVKIYTRVEVGNNWEVKASNGLLFELSFDKGPLGKVVWLVS